VPGLDPNALHLINGDVAAGTFKQAIANTARLIIQRDVLSIGPTPAFLGMETWTRLRLEFWRGILGALPDIDYRLRATDLALNVERLATAGKVYVWTATGNTDQLMVTFLFEILEQVGADPGKVELIEFTQLPPGNRRVLAVGALDAMHMRLHPAPRVLQVEEWMAFRQAWRAISSDDPHKVERFRHRQSAGLRVAQGRGPAIAAQVPRSRLGPERLGPPSARQCSCARPARGQDHRPYARRIAECR
jgi:hypothetical protein